MTDKYVDDYWRKLVAATPEEKQRGKARHDAIDHLRRASAALSAAQLGERDSVRAASLRSSQTTVAQVQHELEAIG